VKGASGIKQSCTGNFQRREILPWVKKAHQESLSGTTTVMLLPCRTETKWWHWTVSLNSTSLPNQDYAVPYAEICWIKGKVKFDEQKDTLPFAVAIFIFQPKESVREARARGGRKAAANMSPEKRKERAQKAAAARRIFKTNTSVVFAPIQKTKRREMSSIRAGELAPPAQGQRERVCEVKGVEKTTRAPSARHRMHPLVRTSKRAA
jgi:hypothetical protein